jgi:hypothetical protein
VFGRQDEGRVTYADGTEVRLWDRVQPWEGCRGVVVFSIDSDEFSPDFPKEHWAYLGRGVMVATDKVGLVHLDESECDCLTLLEKGGPPTPEEWLPFQGAIERTGGGPE